jgi:hypothetical protein
MNYLKNKSLINSDAADLLHKQPLFAPVVHCAYYSCVQYMLYIMIDIFGMTEDKIDNEVKSHKARANGRGGKHEYLINFFTQELRSKPDERRSFESINLLKKLRGVADYENKEVDYRKSQNSIDLSKQVLKVLKTNFK